jgi:aspartyl-tRNA(Asn)/glutamyl-tRNA(Gln) amidotransferase subunit B
MPEINYDAYEIVVGLEVHAQLLTSTKLFCGDSAAFGGEPNTQVSPVTLGYPGALPRLNRKAVEFAIRMGLACHSEIERNNYFARKNYFYPDLPKGYQISQHTTPICKGGRVTIRTEEGQRDVVLNRIHLEEDAGKSLHDVDPRFTAIDLNRAGVPLIEIVTEPDIRTSEEAYVYLTELRKMLRYLDICDGNMEEGSMRCDANVSVRLKGETRLGTKVEVKNLNSIRNVRRAIDFESRRLIGLVAKGLPVQQETRSFDAINGTAELRLSEYDARVICDDKETVGYFESLIAHTSNYKAAANWLLGPVKSSLNEQGLDWKDFPVPPQTLSRLIQLVDEGRLSFSIAAERIFPELVREPSRQPLDIAVALNLIQSSDTAEISAWIELALAGMPDKVTEYRKGKKGLIGLFVGEVKKLSRGKADPKLTNQLLLEKLENQAQA